ncbi:putative cytokinetic ring protein SteA [Salibacterium aidingense]|uniref:putative cytokinetic ring protein SteA n=1 Tax=Salibacterium aidingense TaxID=384933 RepID=UPI003BD82A21
MVKIKGRAFYHKKTKELVKFIHPNNIAVLAHEDIDSTAAETLIDKKVKAVINVKPSMTGRFMQDGVIRLLNKQIRVFDIHSSEIGPWVNQREVEINQDRLFLDYSGRKIEIGFLQEYTQPLISALNEKAAGKKTEAFEDFCGNSFYYASRDLETLLKQWENWKGSNSLQGQDVCIVIRGADYVQDLYYANKYFLPPGMCRIAVDGAADEMRKMGECPDYIIGDMDSVSNSSLCSGARLIVHEDRDGRAPGLHQIQKQKLTAETVRFVGLSEDAAIAFALKEGAEKIYLIGGHRDMEEYLSKGRKGMGSSLLMRMLAGSRIIDLKGIHHVMKAKKNEPWWKNKLHSLFSLYSRAELRKNGKEVKIKA